MLSNVIKNIINKNKKTQERIDAEKLASTLLHNSNALHKLK